MHKLGVNLDQAKLIVRKARPQIYPNPGFLTQLRDYELKLKKKRYSEN